MSPDIYTDTEESGSESEEGTDDDLSYDEDYDDESIHESDEDEEDDLVSESYTETGDSEDYNDKVNAFSFFSIHCPCLTALSFYFTLCVLYKLSPYPI